MKPNAAPRLTPAQARYWTRRAMAAYFEAHPDGDDWPNAHESSVVRHRNLNYVVLVTEDYDALACYRIRPGYRAGKPGDRLVFMGAAPPWL